MADYSELKRKAQEIRNEVKAGANTANRVGFAIEELVNALEAEEQRAMERENSLTNSIQGLQDDTEDLQSMRDTIDRLGTEKADKSALEATNNEVSKKQNRLQYYFEYIDRAVMQAYYVGMLASFDTTEGGVGQAGVYVSKGVASVYYAERDAENKVVHEDGLYLEKRREGGNGCVLLRSYNAGGSNSALKVRPEGISVSSPSGSVADIVQAIRSLEKRIANLEARLTNTTE